MRDACKLLHDTTLALARAEQQGIRVDTQYCHQEKERLTEKIMSLEEELETTKFVQHWRHVYGAKFNLHSGWQLSRFLYNVKKLHPPKFTSSGKMGATDDETLLQLNIPEEDSLLQIRKLMKVRDTYLDAFLREQVNGILRPMFNLNTVRTYRSSSSNPNFQNIPKRDKESMQICRRALIPRTGHQFVEFDYAGAEVRTAVCYHQDPTMIEYINDPKSDMHGDMAKELFCLQYLNRELPSHNILRNAAKNGFVFPEFYGDYYFNCAVNLACRWGGLPSDVWSKSQGISMPRGTLGNHLISCGIKSLGEFTEHVRAVEEDFWARRFPIYRQWKENWWKQYQRRGYFDMLTGFRCSGVMTKNEVLNSPIQGAAAHCLFWTFTEVDKIMQTEGWKSRLVGQIHDAMLMDVFPGELEHVVSTVKRIGCEELPKVWPWIIVPLDMDVSFADVDASWEKVHTYSTPKSGDLDELIP